MNRSARRELAFKLIYSLEIQKNFDEEAIKIFIEDNNIEEMQNYFLKLIEEIVKNKEYITKRIEENLKENWKIDRISKVELSILELSIYEIKFDEDIPFKVSINEAVELAKKYGESQSSSFINGILANIVKD